MLHGNFDYVNDDTLWDDGIDDRQLPNSMYLREKPRFFEDLPWPPFGPDLAIKKGDLPAKLRYEGAPGYIDVPLPAGAIPGPPQNLRITSQ